MLDTEYKAKTTGFQKHKCNLRDIFMTSNYTGNTEIISTFMYEYSDVMTLTTNTSTRSRSRVSSKASKWLLTSDNRQFNELNLMADGTGSHTYPQGVATLDIHTQLA